MSQDKELKDLHEIINREFAGFKEVHTKYLEEIETNGQARTETKTILDKYNESLSSLDMRMKQMETALRRPAFAGSGNLVEPVTIPGMKAFIAALRGGDGAMMSIDEAERKAYDDMKRKVMTAGDDTTGGYLAPPEYVREIIKAELEFSALRSAARVRTTTARSVQLPKKTGSISASWVGEIEERPETAYTYGMEEVPVHEMSARVRISLQDLEDSFFDLEAELNMEFVEQFAVAEGIAFILGNSVKKPEGILFNTMVPEIVTGHATEIPDPDSFFNLFYGLKTAYTRNASWLLNRSTLKTVRMMKDGNGQYLWAPGMAGISPNTILGAGYTEMPDMPDIGAGTYPVAFGDFRRAYVIIDRLAMAVQRDPYTAARWGQVEFIARKRVGGQVLLPEAIIKLKVAAA